MPRLLTVTEVANYLHVSRSTIHRLLKRNEIPAFRVGANWRFNVEEIDRWRVERQITTPRHRT
jgi:excisionase family DNA binding protein